MQGESEERGRRAPFLRTIEQKQKLFRKVLFLRFKLSTSCRQLESSFVGSTKELFLLPASTGYSIISSVMKMTIRFAAFEELEQVNELRKQVNDLHVSGKPELFKPGFAEELRALVYTVFRDPRRRIVVCENGGALCGYAILNHITKEENPFMFARDYLNIDEFGVDAAHRRQGIAAAMIAFIRDWAEKEGFDRIELNMWEFNEGALAFYEAVGFTTYRRYLEMKL